MFSSKHFLVSSLTFRSVIHFEFIFVCGIRKCPNFVLLHVASSFSSTTCWLIDRKCVGLLLGSILFHWSVWLFLCQYHTVLITVVWSYSWSQGAWYLQLCSFSRLLWLFRVLCVSVQIFKLFVLVLWKMPLVFW